MSLCHPRWRYIISIWYFAKRLAPKASQVSKTFFFAPPPVHGNMSMRDSRRKLSRENMFALNIYKVIIQLDSKLCRNDKEKKSMNMKIISHEYRFIVWHQNRFHRKFLSSRDIKFYYALKSFIYRFSRHRRCVKIRI